MAVEKANSNTTKHTVSQPEQVKVALSGMVDALIHHSARQCVSILVLVVVQREEPEWNSTIGSKIYRVVFRTGPP